MGYYDDTKVDVYYNLHKHLFSIRSRKTGLVIAHRETVTLTNCTFVVQKAGQAKVRKENKKNVHAFVRGNWCKWADKGISERRLHDNNLEIRGAKYNPYFNDTFVDAVTKAPVHKADYVHLAGKAVEYLPFTPVAPKPKFKPCKPTAVQPNWDDTRNCVACGSETYWDTYQQKLKHNQKGGNSHNCPKAISQQQSKTPAADAYLEDALNSYKVGNLVNKLEPSTPW